MYWLYKIEEDRYTVGDSGNISQAIYVDENGQPAIDDDSIPRVGVKMLVGAHYSRSFQSQDWWLTNYIEEILSEEIKDTQVVVKFRTLSGSIYEWRGDIISQRNIQ